MTDWREVSGDYGVGLGGGRWDGITAVMRAEGAQYG